MFRNVWGHAFAHSKRECNRQVLKMENPLAVVEGCLHGGTQNRNEAINALIWQHATKQTHCGLPTVELAAYLAVPHFNDGSDSIKLVLKELGITPGLHCSKACKKLDYNRYCVIPASVQGGENTNHKLEERLQ